MDTKFQTSFIPKRPIVAGGAQTMTMKQPFNLFRAGSLILFILAFLATAGIFGYQVYMKNHLETMQTDLQTAKASLDMKLFGQFIRLDTRINSANSILNMHMAPTLLFQTLQNMTVKNLQFKDFDYRVTDPGGPLMITMHGESSSFNSVALQSVVFSKNKFIENPSFSDLDLNDKGNVTFTFKASIDRELIGYKNIDNPLGTLYGISNDNAPTSFN